MKRVIKPGADFITPGLFNFIKGLPFPLSKVNFTKQWGYYRLNATAGTDYPGRVYCAF
jgi:hypothetical protein